MEVTWRETEALASTLRCSTVGPATRRTPQTGGADLRCRPGEAREAPAATTELAIPTTDIARAVLMVRRRALGEVWCAQRHRSGCVYLVE